MTDNLKHTPEYLNAVDVVCLRCSANTAETDICEVCPVRQTVEGTPVKSKLLASAPELLEALKECITDEGSCAMSKHDVNSAIRRLKTVNVIARAAIQKAVGAE